MLQLLSHFPIFSIFIIFIVWSSYEMHKSTRKDQKNKDNYWNREQASNSVRRKKITDDEYIKIPDFIFEINAYNDEINNCLATLNALKDKNILNLTGKTSTDLKELYGPANLNYVTECDDNFTLMCQTLNTLGIALKKLNELTLATKVLELAVASKSDISSSYIELADIYLSNNTPDKITNLIETAGTLDSLMKDSIIKNLKSLIP